MDHFKLQTLPNIMGKDLYDDVDNEIDWRDDITHLGAENIQLTTITSFS